MDCTSEYALSGSMIASRFELVIFDCDGVLVDSEPIINRAHAEVLTACGCPITERVLVERFCGMSDPDMLEIVEREWGRALPASYADHVGLMIEAGFHQLAPIEGVAEALASLTLPICVASSSNLEQIRQKLEITGLLGRRPSPSRRRPPISGNQGAPPNQTRNGRGRRRSL